MRHDIISKFNLNLGDFILIKNKTYSCELYNDHSQSQYGIRIVSISYKNDNGSEIVCQFFSGIINAYFYNDKELRKLKLEKLNENR